MATGRLANLGQQDWIAVKLTANHAYEITTTGLSAGATIFVGPSAGLPPGDEGVGSDYFDSLPAGTDHAYFMPTTTGIYYIDVQDDGMTAAENYSVTVTAVTADFTDNTSHPGLIVVAGPPANDFYGAGSSDIFFRNASSGANEVWEMYGKTITADRTLGSVSPGWTVAATGDFNGDGKTDIVWRNNTTGANELWLMNGSSISSDGALGAVGTAWTLAGIGDFNGDGNADILWHDATTGAIEMWQMNGSTVLSDTSLGTLDTAWSVAEVGDFNGDGKADILWRNASTGAFQMWLMNGASVISNLTLSGVASSWNIPAVLAVGG